MLTHLNSDDKTQLYVELQARRLSLATFITRITFGFGSAIGAGAFLTWLILPQFPQLIGYTLVLGVFSALSWAYPRLASRGHGTLGGSLYLGWFLGLTAVCLVLMPDMLGGVMVCYVFVALLSNIFIGPRGFWVVLGAGVVLYGLDFIYLYTPSFYRFPALPYHLGAIMGGLTGALVLVVISLYIRKIILSQEELYGESYQSKRELEKKATLELARRKIIQQTIADYVDMMGLVQRGNLAARIPVYIKADEVSDSDEDQLAMLGVQINQTIASLEEMIRQIGEAASGLSSASAEILAAMTQQASGSAEQSAAISQTTTTVHEVRSIAEQAVERAQEVVGAAQQTATVSQNGKQAIQETIESMRQIKDRVESISQNILALSEQTQQIGAIITSVNEIASQSNMLALNASVEAARAGEHGKGFSIVAAEVRSLADQSKQATAQVKAILQEIQKATNASVMTTEEGIKVVEQGVLKAGSSYQTIDQLIGVINESVNRMLQVMAGGRQQATGMEQVSNAMQNIQQVSLQSLTSTRQAEKSAQDLNELACRLNQTLTRYDRKATDGQVDFALARLNHKNWIKRLVAFMDGKAKMTEASVVSHQDCDLGKWLYGKALGQYSGMAEMQELERIHQDFHEGVKRVVRLKTAGETVNAENELIAVQKITDRIFQLLLAAEKRLGNSN